MELDFQTDKEIYANGEIAEVNVRVARADVEDEEDLKVFA